MVGNEIYEEKLVIKVVKQISVHECCQVTTVYNLIYISLPLLAFIRYN